MGSDKALLPWGETTLLDHTLRRLAEVSSHVRILCGSELRYTDRGVPVEIDVVPDAGPLGGLATGLLCLRGTVGLFLGVDLPFVPPTFLQGLVELIEGFDAVVPSPGGRPQPLCGAYRATCLPAVRFRLDAGLLHMTSFWPEVKVRLVEDAELSRHGDAEAMFLNLNTLEDYEGARPR